MIDVNLKVKIIAHPNLGFFFFFLAKLLHGLWEPCSPTWE